MRLGLTLLRALVGGTFFAHGAQKLFGWFGGHGLEATGGAFEQMGFKPGKRHALAAGAGEAGGGALIAAGFLMPAGAAAAVGVMDQAIRTAHWEKGFFNTEGGYEFNLLLAVCALALVDAGPGPLSLDRALGTERSGPLWMLAALAAGLAGPRLVQRLAGKGGDELAAEEPSRFEREAEPAQQAQA